MERLQYLCAPGDEGLEVLTLLRREMHLSTNLLRQLKVTEQGILLDGVRVTVRQRVQPGQVLSVLREPEWGMANKQRQLSEGPTHHRGLFLGWLGFPGRFRSMTAQW